MQFQTMPARQAQSPVTERDQSIRNNTMIDANKMKKDFSFSMPNDQDLDRSIKSTDKNMRTKIENTGTSEYTTTLEKDHSLNQNNSFMSRLNRITPNPENRQ